MSRNFELLQKIEKERELNQTSPVTLDHGFGLSHGLATSSSSVEVRTPESDESQHKQLTKLVEHLFLGVNPPIAVVFSGVDRGDGCSWITVRAALQLAEKVSGSVCLIDGNIVCPSLHRHFGIDNSKVPKDTSFHTNSLRNRPQQLAPANLWLMQSPSLSGGSNARALVSASTEIAKLRREFDYVLIDSPALDLGPEAISLARCADGIVVVVGANSSRREICRRVAREIELSKVRILGTVLNKQTSPVPALIERKLQEYFGTTDF